ncbi:prephenate dehydratase [Mucilaginibacter phyllosphaerae]|uniref:prephenate dehydratase n=1 Tax=Mucilaginibacter phyllosphaerae TaxID=1812349 RepID=A0A4Y8ABV3_9SPHI|nr:prephenate dehydratase [Mucilaginibacter phyllosphaerae]MBB3969135.1 prephenate dehydratase [Mucilaginibacter phyllosphaerae]TEW66051.1 prephenate dehydratase [Mucilaginibacter phyllosphaerae]GGH06537.1 prephenate dehydratase [Mucilaginibacter phyllosphaerae]
MKTEKPRVAIQGIRASFHEEAAFKYFGEKIETIECNSFKQTFEALQNGEADYVVMAIENSIAGSILPNYSLMMSYSFPVVGEVYVPIQLHLMALPGVRFEDIKYVNSHPIAIRQCIDFFDEYPHLKIVESNDTAACAKRIRDEQLTDTVAIANTLAAQLYGLDVLERRIESNKKNFTRFLIMTTHENAKKKGTPNKASLCFQVSNQVGALAKVLNIFAQENVNMSKIQSMPVLGKRNEYNFYVDIEWTESRQYDNAIRHILKYTQNFNILGEYQRYEEDTTPKPLKAEKTKRYINVKKLNEQADE